MEWNQVIWFSAINVISIFLSALCTPLIINLAYKEKGVKRILGLAFFTILIFIYILLLIVWISFILKI